MRASSEYALGASEVDTICYRTQSSLEVSEFPKRSQGFMKREPSRDSLLNLLLPLALILGLVLILSLNVGEARDERALTSPLETWLKVIVGYLAAATEIAAAVVIGGAVIRGITSYLRLLFARSKQHFDATEAIRLQLGRVLALGLEFTVASDILRTAVAPTRQDILNLGAIVLLRTLLNYFLEREIQQGEQRRLPEPEIDRSIG
ncbi:DUF1622 domain-containing protein [Dendronalium sp. ChiSLP03b]|uniref:DUF1622 domain-containing protein n=1 Tax=Dendronalium sp. ChiSLP03b TaxID=3075381 RepID=UPI002AD20733|nr:DUF1622 domain-containing protein [Dendronalium sp. ChiSLP03b]MDZ8203614.1 DUF1622 domain-containing protein [Dendronalium sp. ChiSLP03b]